MTGQRPLVQSEPLQPTPVISRESGAQTRGPRVDSSSECVTKRIYSVNALDHFVAIK